MKSASKELQTDPLLEAASAWCLRLAQGALPPADQVRLEAWLEAAPENRRAFEDAVGVWRAVGETGITPDLLALRRDALASFETANRAQWDWRTSRAPVWAGAIAACVALLIGVGWIALGMMPTTYVTGVGERRVIVLSDGSKLSLDAATEVSVRYAAHARMLRLERGRAEFEVAKDASRPFTVAAADKLVRATGTAFSVELLQGSVQVVLYQGRVKVFNLKDAAGLRPVILQRTRLQAAASAGVVADADDLLTPGRELVAPLKLASAQVTADDPARSLAWEGGQLVFDNEPLASAVERVNRYSNEKLSIGDAKAGAVRVDGVFTAGDTDAFVDGVTELLPVRVREADAGRVLVSR
jgi:transmembrane sensor